jgi:hypothetical protein
MTSYSDSNTTPERLTGMSVIEVMASRFTSLNPIPVERASIRREEWAALLKDIRDTGELGFHGNRRDRNCHSCEMADAINAALEKLK